MNTGLPGYCNKGIPVPRVLCDSLTEVTEVPGKGMGILQTLQKFRVRVRKCYRTRRSFGYCGTGVQNSQKFRAGIKMLYTTGCTELTEVPGTGINVVQNLQKIRVRVWMSIYSGGTRVSWDFFFFLNSLERKTWQHLASIVIGLKSRIILCWVLVQ